MAAVCVMAVLLVSGCWMNTHSGTVHALPPDAKEAPQYAPRSRFTVNEGAADRFDPDSFDLDAGIESFREFLFDW